MTEFLAKDDSQKHLKTRLRRLYAQAYYSTSVSLSNATEEKDPAAKVTMHIADRVSRTEGLRKRIVGFKLEHHNMPGNALINKANTILVTGVVRWIAWIICISRASEHREEPEIKGLRVTADGLLTQDVVKDLVTSVCGELLWDYALRRRGLAMDISGLMTFEAHNDWHDMLKDFPENPACRLQAHQLVTDQGGRPSSVGLRRREMRGWHQGHARANLHQL